MTYPKRQILGSLSSVGSELLVYARALQDMAAVESPACAGQLVAVGDRLKALSAELSEVQDRLAEGVTTFSAEFIEEVGLTAYVHRFITMLGTVKHLRDLEVAR